MSVRARLAARAAQQTLSSRLTLGFAILLIVLSMAQLAYRFTLPTDGWSVYTTELDEPNWVYLQNLVGAPSGLQPDDELLNVDNQSVQGTATVSKVVPPPHWQAGQTVSMLIIRDGQEITVDVPVVHWTARALWRRISSSTETATGLAGALILAFVGFFTFSRRPNLPSARALLIFCATITSLTISSLLPDGLSVAFANTVAYIMVSFFSYAIFGTVLAPSLLAFTLHFPRTKRIILRRQWLGYIPAFIGLSIALTVFGGDDTAIIGWLGTLSMVAFSILSLVHSGFTQRDAVSRAQMRWAVGGFIAGLALFLLAFPSAFGWVTDFFWASLLAAGPSMGFTVIGVSLAVAVLRYRLWDIDLIIRRTLVYGLVTILLGLIYFGGVTLLQSLLISITGQQSALAIVITTLAIAALFNPLRNRVQRTVDRRFFRASYDAQQTLERFNESVRDKIDIDDLEHALLEAVSETMQPDSIRLWIKDTL